MTKTTYEIRCRPSIMKVPTLDESLSIHLSTKSTKSKSTCQLSTSSSTLDRSLVSFHHVEIREYPMTLSDNPSSRTGPPVGISWEYTDETAIKLDDYESERGERRTLSQMILPRERKYDIIKESGVSNKQIANTIRKVNKIKNQRMQTTNNVTFAKFEEGLESAMRKMKRFLLRRKSDSKWWENWKKENQDLLDISVHNGRINRVVHSNHSLEKIPSEHSSHDDMSEISTVSSGVLPSTKPIIICEEEDD